MEQTDSTSWTMSLRRFRQTAIVTVVGLCVVVVAGGVVRLTGSGLGCDDWPNCNSERFVDVSSGHTAIEQINRLASAVLGIPVLIMTVGSFRVRPRGRRLVAPSLIVLVSVLANGVVGGIAVRGDLHPALVQSHFLLTMASIALALVVVRRAGERPSRPVGDRGTRFVFWAIGVATVAALVTGTVVTGTGPHAGVVDVRRFGFAISDPGRLDILTVLSAAVLVVVTGGVATRAWSSAAAPAGLMPGLTARKSTPCAALMAATSCGDETTPSQPALCAR